MLFGHPEKRNEAAGVGVARMPSRYRSSALQRWDGGTRNTAAQNSPARTPVVFFVGKGSLISCSCCEREGQEKVAVSGGEEEFVRLIESINPARLLLLLLPLLLSLSLSPEHHDPDLLRLWPFTGLSRFFSKGLCRYTACVQVGGFLCNRSNYDSSGDDDDDDDDNPIHALMKRQSSQ